MYNRLCNTMCVLRVPMLCAFMNSVCVCACARVCVCACICDKLWNALLVSGYIPTTSRDVKAQWGAYHGSPRTSLLFWPCTHLESKVGSMKFGKRSRLWITREFLGRTHCLVQIASGCFNLTDFVNRAPALLSIKAVQLHCTRNPLFNQHKFVCRPQLVRVAERSDSLLSRPCECTAVPPESSPCMLP